MKYTNRELGTKCKHDYFEYELNDKNELVITDYYIESQYDYDSLVSDFLYRHCSKRYKDAIEMSDESLIKYKNIFTKSNLCIDRVTDIIISKPLNIDVIKTYISYLDIVNFLNKTKTEDEKIFELIASNQLSGKENFEDLEAINITFFNKYLKPKILNATKTWSEYKFSHFIAHNSHLTYNNFYKENLDMFKIKFLMLKNVDIPTTIVEDYLFKNFIAIKDKGIKVSSSGDYDYIKIMNNYSDNLSKDFIINNVNTLNKVLNWGNINLNIDVLMDLERSIGVNILDCYGNNSNIFPIKNTINYIKKYINMDVYIESVEKCMDEFLSENNWYPYEIEGDIQSKLNILLNYKYLNTEVEYSLKLMLEISETCHYLLKEFNNLTEVELCIKSVKQNASKEYLNKIKELRTLFENIKNDI